MCDSWGKHQTRLFSSAAVVPQSKFTDLCSSAAVLPQGKFTELCSSASVVPQSKSNEMRSSAAPFHHDLWYFRHRRNGHFSSMLFIRKTYKPNYWKRYWCEPHTHSTEGFDDSLEACGIERCCVREPVFKHYSLNRRAFYMRMRQYRLLKYHRGIFIHPFVSCLLSHPSSFRSFSRSIYFLRKQHYMHLFNKLPVLCLNRLWRWTTSSVRFMESWPFSVLNGSLLSSNMN